MAQLDRNAIPEMPGLTDDWMSLPPEVRVRLHEQNKAAVAAKIAIDHAMYDAELAQSSPETPKNE
jgi:hypothetical protein